MSDNTAGRCQARRPGRLLEATCKRCPRGMAVTYRLPLAGGALQNPAYRLADVLQMRGSAQHRRTPRQFKPGLLGFLKLLATFLATIHCEPIRPVANQKRRARLSPLEFAAHPARINAVLRGPPSSCLRKKSLCLWASSSGCRPSR